MAGRSRRSRSAPREHEDVDLSILACDIPALREQVGDRLAPVEQQRRHAARRLTDKHPDVLDVRSQIWIRASAQDPWVVDLPITPDRDGLWTNKFLPGHVLPVEEATWVADDGIRYLQPRDRPASTRRVTGGPRTSVTWTGPCPLLAPGRRAWLRDAVRHAGCGAPVAGPTR